MRGGVKDGLRGAVMGGVRGVVRGGVRGGVGFCHLVRSHLRYDAILMQQTP